MEVEAQQPCRLGCMEGADGYAGGREGSEGSVALPEPSRGERQLAPLGGCSRFRTVHTN